ncbi:metallopeptidase TldD-related protein [Tardisphaera miroshnichenkoae]
MIELTSDALSYAQEHGAEYVEVRGETTEFLDLLVEDRGVVHSVGGIYNGVGIRTFYGSGRGYSSTSFITKTSIERAVEESVRMARASNFGTIKVKPIEGRVENVKAPMKQDPREIDSQDKVKEVLALARAASKVTSAKLARVRYLELYEDRTLATNYGLRLRGIKPSIYVSIEAYGEDWQLIYEDGYVGGWEVFKQIRKDVDEFYEQLSFSPTEAEAESVVLSPRAASHFIIDDVLPQYVFPNESSYDHFPLSNLEILDDPTIESGYGYMPFDDEGVKAEPIQLVAGGDVKRRLTTRELDEHGGRARAQDFIHEPGPANSNTKVMSSEKTSMPKDFYYVPFIYSLGSFNLGEVIWLYSPLTVVYKGGAPVGRKALRLGIDLSKVRLKGIEGESKSFGCLRNFGGGLIPIAEESEALLLEGETIDRGPT